MTNTNTHVLLVIIYYRHTHNLANVSHAFAENKDQSDDSSNDEQKILIQNIDLNFDNEQFEKQQVVCKFFLRSNFFCSKTKHLGPQAGRQ